MRLAVLGGGGFRVPLVHAALLAARCDGSGSAGPVVDDVVLHDVDDRRLAAVAAVLAQQASGHPDPPAVRTATVLDDALRDADVVFCAVRVGGLAGRTADERVALDAGVLGQETTGPGGVAYGLRTVPVAVAVAERVAAVAPRAWLVNFTNPAGMVTEAVQRVLGARAIGICDSPTALVRRADRALGLPEGAGEPDYAGLNHLGWLRRLVVGGRDVLPDLLADDAALATVEEARLLGLDWVRSLGALPNEYLFYYYRTREALAALRGGAATRGEFLLAQQERFYADVAREPADALATWQRVRAEREATYLAEGRGPADPGRDAADLTGGGYEGIALAVMAALTRPATTAGGPARLVLDVARGPVLPGLPDGAVVEVPCAVDGNGARPLPVAPLTGHMLGLAAQVKEVERLTIDAALTGSPRTALKALALHPLVDSVATAQVLLDGYRARIPEVAAVLR